jgi:hypothetical protein
LKKIFNFENTILKDEKNLKFFRESEISDSLDTLNFKELKKKYK